RGVRIMGGEGADMRRREFISLLAGAAAAQLPAVALAQDNTEWVTGFAREPVRVATWPAGRKVAVSFALFVEEFGFGQGPVLRPDLASRNPDLVNEAFRQYAIDWASRALGGCSRSSMFHSASC